MWNLQRLHVSAPKAPRTVRRGLCAELSVCGQSSEWDRAGLVAECEMCFHGLLCLITDPKYPNGKAGHTRKKSEYTMQVTSFVRWLTMTAIITPHVRRDGFQT